MSDPDTPWYEADVHEDGTVEPYEGTETYYFPAVAVSAVETPEGRYLSVIVDEPGTYAETRVTEVSLNLAGYFRKGDPNALD